MENKLVKPKQGIYNAQGKFMPSVAMAKAPKDEKLEEGVLVFKTPIIKFKRPNRQMVVFDIEKQMGFRPKRIMLKLSDHTNNGIILGIIDDDRESKLANEMDKNEDLKKDVKNNK